MHRPNTLDLNLISQENRSSLLDHYQKTVESSLIIHLLHQRTRISARL